MHSIGLDAHKRYSQFEVLDHLGKTISKGRIQHDRGALKEFFSQFPAGTPVALETVGNWYWIADEIEAAECLPRLAHAAKAKVMMGNVNKTDKIDAHGLAILQHNNTLPAVWIAPHQVRDEENYPGPGWPSPNSATPSKTAFTPPSPSTLSPSRMVKSSSASPAAVGSIKSSSNCRPKPSDASFRSSPCLILSRVEPPPI